MLFCGCAWKRFCGSVVQRLSQVRCYSRGQCGHCFVVAGPPCLSEKRQPCKYLLERLFEVNTKDGRSAFSDCCARLIDNMSLIHLAAAHRSFLHSTIHNFSSMTLCTATSDIILEIGVSTFLPMVCAWRPYCKKMIHYNFSSQNFSRLSGGEVCAGPCH